jgi:hypothetical protein
LSNDAPLGFVPANFVAAPWLFIALIVLLYGWMLRRANAVR